MAAFLGFEHPWNRFGQGGDVPGPSDQKRIGKTPKAAAEVGLQSLEGTLHCTDPASENLMGHTFPIVRILVNDSFEKCIPIYCQSYFALFSPLNPYQQSCRWDRKVWKITSHILFSYPHFRLPISESFHISPLFSTLPDCSSHQATPRRPRLRRPAARWPPSARPFWGRGKGGKGGKAAGRGLGAEAGAGDSSEVPWSAFFFSSFICLMYFLYHERLYIYNLYIYILYIIIYIIIYIYIYYIYI